MIVKTSDTNLVQITCTLEEKSFLLHVLLNSKYTDADFVEKFSHNPYLQYCVKTAKENIILADKMISELR